MDLFKKEYNPSDLPFHIIAPSLTGYAFSSGPPLNKDFSIEDTTRLMNHLMLDLGFGDGYIAQGGDVGCGISRLLGAEYPACKGPLYTASAVFQRH